MFTARIAYSADFLQSQVPRTKRYLLYFEMATATVFTSLILIVDAMKM